ncbi:hypothetical protein NS365_04525 [Aureimonas ureilytica]|uniref:Putative tail fiber protein gp53-like C-terminal domain-containing protein n=1 Tax=Aureimonas ureilytica TaxID=401562 RepID=A0A175RUX2_9HYPH|nr:hypothetical protein [Aureimonas ureilytica]KTR07327.1 hypothetical protein NS365_04525 [Aureimonas ureilytica]
MTQADFGTIIPSQTSGPALASKLNARRDAEDTSHSGSTRPSYVKPGMVWLDTSATPWVYKMWDGQHDALLRIIDPSTGIAKLPGRQRFESFGFMGHPDPDRSALEVYGTQANGGMAAIMLHREGSFATYFGLNTSNVLAWGGYSQGNNQYRIWEDKAAPKSLASIGYQVLPSGLIVQWGSVSLASSNGVDHTGSATFPTTFPTECAQVVLGGTTETSAGDDRLLGNMGLSKTRSTVTVQCRNNVSAGAIFTKVPYIAVGY